MAICDPTTLEAEFRHGEGSIPVECNRSSIDQRGIQNPIKQPDKLLAVNYFRKTLYIRCLIGFWIRLCRWLDCVTTFNLSQGEKPDKMNPISFMQNPTLNKITNKKNKKTRCLDEFCNNHKKATAMHSFYDNVTDLRLAALLKVDINTVILCNNCEWLHLNVLFIQIMYPKAYLGSWFIYVIDTSLYFSFSLIA